MVAVAAVMGVVVAGLAIPFAGVVGLGARDVARTMDSLPEELKTEALPEKTTIVDSRGDTIATCLLYTSPSPRDGLLSRMPSSA